MQLEALRKDMVAAMKAKDKVTKEAVSSLVAAAKKAAIDEGCRDDVPEALVAVSYTHLDVYKRQGQDSSERKHTESFGKSLSRQRS